MSGGCEHSIPRPCAAPPSTTSGRDWLRTRRRDRPMRNIRLVLSYDGTDFSGWQTQPGFRTVQETLEAAIAAVTAERVRVNASGRTDAGVHALGQVVNFHSTTHHPPDVLLRAVNANLPADIVVR